MRRARAAAVLGISLWIGSLAWSGFIVLRTVLDPGRSEAVADALLDDPAVHDQLVDNIANGLDAAVPNDVPVNDATLDAAAERALATPEVEALFRAAFVDTHRALLGEGDPPTSLDGTAFGQAARDSVVESRPELDAVLPEAPSVVIPLPTERVPDLGGVRRGLETAVPLLAGVAALGTIAALMVTSNRPAVLRRAGIWAIGLSALVLLLAYGIPALVGRAAPGQAAVVAALVDALAASTRLPALVLAGAGVAALVVSLVWRPRRGPVHARAGGAEPLPRQPRVARQRRPGPAGGRAIRPPTRPPAVPPTRPPARPADPTTVATPTRASPTRPAPPVTARTRWVDSVGWVLEDGQAIPDGARWVAGVGYVVEPGPEDVTRRL